MGLRAVIADASSGWLMSTVATSTAALQLVQASDVDAELEARLTGEFDARIVDYSTARLPFSEWVLGRIRGIGYPVENLDDLHTVIPQIVTPPARTVAARSRCWRASKIRR